MALDKDYSFDLDLKNKGSYPRMEFVAQDKNASILYITVTDDGVPVDLTGYSAQLNVRKADGTLVVQDTTTEGKVTIHDAVNGVIKVILLMQTIAAPGDNYADVSITNATDKVTTNEFKFYVRDNKDNDNAVDSSDYITAFEQLMDDLNAEFQVIIDEYNASIESQTNIEVVNARNGETNLGVRLNKIDGAGGTPSKFIFGDNSRSSLLYAGDLNSLLKSGFYYTSGGANRPVANNGFLLHIQHATSDAYAGQYYLEYNKASLWTRTKNNGTWTAWSKIWTDFNDGKDSGLDADLWRGKVMYKTMEELGLSGSPTVPQILNAMAEYSEASIIFGVNANMPADFVIFEAQQWSKAQDVRYVKATTFYPESNFGRQWIGAYRQSSGTFSGWKELYHSGNYDVEKFVYGNYTITDADHGKQIIQGNMDANNYTITVPIGTSLRLGFKCTILERLIGTGRTSLTPSSGSMIYSNPDNTKRTLNGTTALAVLSRFGTGTDFTLIGNLRV